METSGKSLALSLCMCACMCYMECVCVCIGTWTHIHHGRYVAVSWQPWVMILIFHLRWNRVSYSPLWKTDQLAHELQDFSCLHLPSPCKHAKFTDVATKTPTLRWIPNIWTEGIILMWPSLWPLSHLPRREMCFKYELNKAKMELTALSLDYCS